MSSYILGQRRKRLTLVVIVDILSHLCQFGIVFPKPLRPRLLQWSLYFRSLASDQCQALAVPLFLAGEEYLTQCNVFRGVDCETHSSCLGSCVLVEHGGHYEFLVSRRLSKER